MGWSWDGSQGCGGMGLNRGLEYGGMRSGWVRDGIGMRWDGVAPGQESPRAGDAGPTVPGPAPGIPSVPGCSRRTWPGRKARRRLVQSSVPGTEPPPFPQRCRAPAASSSTRSPAGTGTGSGAPSAPNPPKTPGPRPRPYLGARGRSGGGRPGPRSWRRDFGRAGPERRGRSGPGESPERPARLGQPALHSGIPPSPGIPAPASRPSGPEIPRIPTLRIPAFRPSGSGIPPPAIPVPGTGSGKEGGARGRELRRRMGGRPQAPQKFSVGAGVQTRGPHQGRAVLGSPQPRHPASAAQCRGTPKPRQQRHGRGGPGPLPGVRQEKLLGDSRPKYGAFSSQPNIGSQAKPAPLPPAPALPTPRAPDPAPGSRWMVALGLPVPLLSATRPPGTPKPKARGSRGSSAGMWQDKS